MRLLNTGTLRLEEIADDEEVAGKYAILSHTWGTDEVNYQDMVNGHETLLNSAAYRNKIENS